MYFIQHFSSLDKKWKSFMTEMKDSDIWSSQKLKWTLCYYPLNYHFQWNIEFIELKNEMTVEEEMLSL